MKLKNIHELTINVSNPRVISEFKLGKLIESLLVFPKMLSLRPIVINSENIVLGGNQRLVCLHSISKMSKNDIEGYLLEQLKYRDMSDDDQKKLLKYWTDWQKKQTVPVVDASDFTNREENEFMVKDNLGYGEDDFDLLRSQYDPDQIENYFGEVDPRMHDYSEKINYDDIEINQLKAIKFSCGNIESLLTEEEYDWIVNKYKCYIMSTPSGENFVSHILNLK